MLTQITLNKMQPGVDRREIPDGKVGGLFHVVQPTGARSWALRYRMNGKPAKFTLGSYPALSLGEARKRALEAHVLINRGESPGEAKKAVRMAAKAAMEASKAARVPGSKGSVEHAIDEFILRHVRPNTRPNSAAETERILRREILPAWQGRRLADMKRADVHALLDAVVDRGSPIMANRVLAAVSKLFAWTVERDLIPASPCNGVRLPSKETSRDRVLTDVELVKAWTAFQSLGHPFGPLLSILALTAQRKEEVAQMRWAEVDLDAGLWTIPKERSKNSVAHVVPLTPRVVAILRSLPVVNGSPWIFTTTGQTPVSGVGKAKSRADALAGNDGDDSWTLHDLRRTWATVCARLGIPPHVVEAALNHVSGTVRGVAAIYNRASYAEEKREAMNSFDVYLQSLLRA